MVCPRKSVDQIDDHHGPVQAAQPVEGGHDGFTTGHTPHGLSQFGIECLDTNGKPVGPAFQTSRHLVGIEMMDAPLDRNLTVVGQRQGGRQMLQKPLKVWGRKGGGRPATDVDGMHRPLLKTPDDPATARFHAAVHRYSGRSPPGCRPG